MAAWLVDAPAAAGFACEVVVIAEEMSPFPGTMERRSRFRLRDKAYYE